MDVLWTLESLRTFFVGGLYRQTTLAQHELDGRPLLAYGLWVRAKQVVDVIHYTPLVKRSCL